MCELPGLECGMFIGATALYVAAAVVGMLQLRPGGARYARLLVPLVALAVIMEAVLLIFRAAAIQAVPLTGLFESMIVLTMVFGAVYLVLGLAITQVWFGSAMVWCILLMMVVTGLVASPAAEPQKIAATPWAVAHGVAMVLAGAATTFAFVCAILYLLGVRKLKRKEVQKVIGKVPNLEKLERMNLYGIKAAFVLITIGLASGLGLAAWLGTGMVNWLTDGKVVCIIGAWVLLGLIFLTDHLRVLNARARTYMTAVAFLLVLFAVLGVTILGVTRHNFAL